MFASLFFFVFNSRLHGSCDRLIHELNEGHDRLLLFEGDTEENYLRKLFTEEARNKRKDQRVIGVVL